MGRDKALLSVAGRPLVEHALSILEQAGLPASIAGANPSTGAALQPTRQSSRTPNPASALWPASAPPWLPLPRVTPFFCPSICLSCRPRSSFFCFTTPESPAGPSLFPRSMASPRPSPQCSTDPSCPLSRPSSPPGAAAAFPPFRQPQPAWTSPSAAVTVEFLAQSGQIVHPLGLPPALWFLNLNYPSGS